MKRSDSKIRKGIWIGTQTIRTGIAENRYMLVLNEAIRLQDTGMHRDRDSDDAHTRDMHPNLLSTEWWHPRRMLRVRPIHPTHRQLVLDEHQVASPDETDLRSLVTSLVGVIRDKGADNVFTQAYSLTSYMMGISPRSHVQDRRQWVRDHARERRKTPDHHDTM